jgi:hypothetical protein
MPEQSSRKQRGRFWGSLLELAKTSTHRDDPPEEEDSSRDYTYEPLQGKSSIRLLRLFAGSDDPLKAQLQHFVLGKTPKYRALSYVWGPPNFSETVILKGGFLQITLSLSDALKELRDPLHHVWIWADAICINQRDDQERGLQVKLMIEIYKNAYEVPIRLGLPNGCPAEKTVEVLRKIKSTRANLIESLRSDDWDVLGQLFSNEWFGRVWIVQEAILARSPVFCCGAERISWKLIGGQAERIYNLLPLNFPESARRGAGIVYDMQVIRDTHLGHPFSLSLAQLAQNMRVSSCSDDRDRVYGILGLTWKGEDLIALTEPDYTKSTDEVYLDFAQRVMDEDFNRKESLRILTYIDHGTELYDWSPGSKPSWVPYWNSGPSSFALLYRLYSASFGIEAFKGPNYLEPHTFGTEGRYLHANGFIHTRVKTRHFSSTGSVAENTTAIRFETILRAWEVVVEPLLADMASMEEVHRLAFQLHNVILEGRVNFERTSSPKAFNHFVNYSRDAGRELATTKPTTALCVERMLKVLEEALESLRLSKTKQGKKKLADALYVPNAIESVSLEKSYRRTRWHRFSTDTGQLGVGTSALREGDLVCILEGSAGPCVLRKQDDFHQFVGTVYVSGIMDGEAVVGWKSRGGEMQGFEIR